MRFGIDFDNTIACYEGAFHAAALERGLIPADLPRGKVDVRNYLNGAGLAEAFTELQGYLYGARMDLVSVYPGFQAFLAEALAQRHELFIVSHKTRRPIAGPAYDLHEAALGFLHAQGITQRLAPGSQIFFEETKEAKIARAAALDVDVFVDDLPEILAMPGFPVKTRAILFDPESHYPDGEWRGHRFDVHRDWDSVASALLVARS